MKNDEMTKYTHRYLARIVIEAETPLAVGSGDKDLLTDALVATDSNSLPYIPGTSIAGVFRSMLASVTTPAETDELFGFQGKKKDNDKADGKGSDIIFTEAKILDSRGCVMDGLRNLDTISADPLLGHYASLPVRQHVKITDKGVAANTGLFSSQVVFAGSRFCFEIEMVSDGSNYALFESVLNQIHGVIFRLGGGTRDGFGKIRAVELGVMDLDLGNPADLDIYLSKPSKLDSDFWEEHETRTTRIGGHESTPEDIIRYRLILEPESFFQFGSGYSDDEADMTPIKGKKVEWKESANGMTGTLRENLVLIPATSVKGALSHRTAFHYNRHRKRFADDLTKDEIKNSTGNGNDAVRILFGSKGNPQGEGMTRGNVIFSDIIQGEIREKLFNHLKIDRFTGGGIEGALFSEKGVYGAGTMYETEILIDTKVLQKAYDKNNSDGESEESLEIIIKAFEDALNDLCNGMLPLGGGVNRGHGVFTGKFTKLKKEEDGKN